MSISLPRKYSVSPPPKETKGSKRLTPPHKPESGDHDRPSSGTEWEQTKQQNRSHNVEISACNGQNVEEWRQRFQEMSQPFQSTHAHLALASRNPVDQNVLWEDKKRMIQAELDNFPPIVTLAEGSQIRTSQHTSDDGNEITRELYLQTPLYTTEQGTSISGEQYLSVTDYKTEGARLVEENMVTRKLSTEFAAEERTRITQRKKTSQTNDQVVGYVWKEIQVSGGKRLIGERLLEVESLLSGSSVDAMQVRHYRTEDGKDVQEGNKEVDWEEDGEHRKGKVRLKVTNSKDWSKISQRVKELHSVAGIEHDISTNVERYEGGEDIQILTEILSHTLSRRSAEK